MLMPRNPHFSSACTVNFQVSEDMRAAIHELAKRQDRSASAVIRSAVRAMLVEQASEQPQQRGKQESTLTT
jgi:predicted transcriptional regulator